MNYFAHGVAFLDRPYLMAGTAVPDWLMVADRRLRIRPRQVEAWLKQARTKDSRRPEPSRDVFTELVQGIGQHLADDRRFHANPAFLELSYRLSRDVAELLDGPHPSAPPSGTLPEKAVDPAGRTAVGWGALGRAAIGKETGGWGYLGMTASDRATGGRETDGIGAAGREGIGMGADLPSDAPGGYAAFVGHLLLEVLLDAALIEENPIRLEQYYQRLDQVDVQLVQEAVNRMTPRQTLRLAPMIAEFRRLRVLWDYLEDRKLLDRVNQVMRRVRLPELPEAFSDLLPKARQAVASRKQQLLEGIPSRMDSMGQAQSADVGPIRLPRGIDNAQRPGIDGPTRP
jgi:hypothetical protein